MQELEELKRQYDEALITDYDFWLRVADLAERAFNDIIEGDALNEEA